MRRPRLDNWAAAMRSVLAEHRSRPFSWGGSDCGMAFDVVRAITGVDILAPGRGYANEANALRTLRYHGYRSMFDLVADQFVEIPASKAMRGDLGYPAAVPHPLMCPAVIDGPVAYSKSPGEGWVIVPTSHLVRIFAV